MSVAVQNCLFSTDPAAGPPTNPFSPSPMKPLTVMFFCLWCFALCRRFCRLAPGVLLAHVECSFPRKLQTSFGSFVSVSLFGDVRQQETTLSQEPPRFVPAHGSFKAFCPTRTARTLHTGVAVPTLFEVLPVQHRPG